MTVKTAWITNISLKAGRGTRPRSFEHHQTKKVAQQTVQINYKKHPNNNLQQSQSVFPQSPFHNKYQSKNLNIALQSFFFP